MASDLISRNALIKDMYEDGYFHLTVADKATEKVMAQPTVDAVEVVHGEWIKADSMPRSAKCSECNCWITRHTINENWFRYCPHCGAKMDGGDKA